MHVQVARMRGDDSELSFVKRVLRPGREPHNDGVVRLLRTLDSLAALPEPPPVPQQVSSPSFWHFSGLLGLF